MAETKKVGGSCHCGKVRYEFVFPRLDRVVECDCSLCKTKGTKMILVPTEGFKVLSGLAHLQEYDVGQPGLTHMFCTSCGIHSFATGVARGKVQLRLVNIRCVDGVQPPDDVPAKPR